MSFIKSLDDAGIVCNEYDVATGWPKALDLERLVVLQYPDNERLQIVLHSTLKGACCRREIASTPAMAWAGLYLGSPGTRTPFDKLLETADHAIDAPAFSEWLQRSDTEPSVHIAVWFAKFGILGRSPVVAGHESVKQVDTMKKSALIAEFEYEWPSIVEDISEATRNGLKAAAHTGKHGRWDTDKARAWAVSNGKIKQSAPVHSLAAAWSGTTTRPTNSG